MQDRRFDSVLVQNQSGSKRAVQHLITEHGHRRIVFIGLNDSFTPCGARFEGYRRAMVEAGLRPAILQMRLPGVDVGDRGRRAAREKTRRRPSSAPTI